MTDTKANPNRPPKQQIPPPKEGRSELDHVIFMSHVLDQVKAGHYYFRQTLITQGDPLPDGGVPFTAQTVRYETNPRNPAAPYDPNQARQDFMAANKDVATAGE